MLPRLATLPAATLATLALLAAPADAAFKPAPKGGASQPKTTPHTPPKQEIPTKNDCSGERVVNMPTLRTLPLIQHRGDTKIGGDRRLKIDLRTITAKAAILLTGSIRVVENRADSSMVRHIYRRVPVTVPLGCEIKDITPARGDLRKGHERGNGRAHWIDGSNTPALKLIRRARCRTGKRGDDKNQLGCGEIELSPVTVRFQPRTECGSLTIPRPVVSMSKFRNLNGTDAEFAVKRPRVEIEAKLHTDRNALDLEVNAKVIELGGDNTVLGATQQQRILVPRTDMPGCVIESLSGDVEGTIRGRVASSGDQPKLYKSSPGRAVRAEGALKEATCVIDSDNDAACSEVRLNFVRVNFKPGNAHEPGPLKR